MGSIHDVIDAFRRAPTNVDRDILFEQLMVRFFELDPALIQQYESVWRWPGRQGKRAHGDAVQVSTPHRVALSECAFAGARCPSRSLKLLFVRLRRTRFFGGRRLPPFGWPSRFHGCEEECRMNQ